VETSTSILDLLNKIVTFSKSLGTWKLFHNTHSPT
jgi:hypothetical protein